MQPRGAWYVQKCHRSFDWKPWAVSKSSLADVHLSRWSGNLLDISHGRSGRVSEKIALPPEVAVLVAGEVPGYLTT